MATELDVTIRELDNQKASQGVFELPCGFLDEDGELHREVKVREMTGNEEDLLASKSTPLHKKMSELLMRCVERVGPYTDPEKINRIVPKLTMGDRFFLMFAVRRVTLGDIYPFTDACPHCKKESLYQIDIGELAVKPMKDPLVRSYEVPLPSGKLANVRVLTGEDEEKMTKIAKSDDMLSLSIQVRLAALNGVPPKLADLKNLSLRDRNALREAFDAYEGGIDTSVEMQCPDCGEEFSSELSVGQAGFFFPSAVSKISKKKSSI